LYFRRFPASWSTDEYVGLEEAGETWKRLFPVLFAGVGDPVPVVFPFEQVRHFFSLSGLIAELKAIEGRQPGA
jgi:hypothetical protein